MIDETIKHEIFRAPRDGILKIYDFLDCHEHVVEYYNNRESSIHDRFRDLMITADDVEIFGQDFGEEIYANNTTYPFIHKSSQLISLYSVLEITIKNLSCLISESIESEIKLESIDERNEIRKCRKFLCKACDIKLAGKTNGFIAEFIQLRNALVHSNGRIRKISCVKTKYVKIDNGVITDIDNEYITYVCNEITGLFRSLGEQTSVITGLRSKSFFLISDEQK